MSLERDLQNHSHSFYVILQVIFHTHFRKFVTTYTSFCWCQVSHALCFFHVDKMEQIIFLCTVSQGGECKLLILGSISI